MTTSESKGRYFFQNESIRIDSHNESNRIANWNALLDGRTVTSFMLRTPINFVILLNGLRNMTVLMWIVID